MEAPVKLARDVSVILSFSRKRRCIRYNHFVMSLIGVSKGIFPQDF